jgi:hypothetical protein
MGQRFEFGFFDTVSAELAGVTAYSLHTDADAICLAADAIAPLAEHLGVPVPAPHMCGMSYMHVAALGAEVVNTPDLPEPWVGPLLRGPGDIDALREPQDYLDFPLLHQRLAVLERRADASTRLGHDFEGPATTAVLLLGQGFFLLACDEPPLAQRLLEFCTTSAIHFAQAMRRMESRPMGAAPLGIPDDFAGMFDPATFERMVAPCWERLYSGLGATDRFLHSELLREGHLPALAGLKITEYDSGVDQYLPAEALGRSCPVPFSLRIWPAWVQSKKAEELVEIYRHFARFRPTSISFHLERMADLPKIEQLLKVARELAKN